MVVIITVGGMNGTENKTNDIKHHVSLIMSGSWNSEEDEPVMVFITNVRLRLLFPFPFEGSVFHSAHVVIACMCVLMHKVCIYV